MISRMFSLTTNEHLARQAFWLLCRDWQSDKREN